MEIIPIQNKPQAVGRNAHRFTVIPFTLRVGEEREGERKNADGEKYSLKTDR